MAVDSQHSEYTESLSKWSLVRDCDEGSSVIKEGKSKYLPKPNAEDTSTSNKVRFDAYIDRANFVNFTAHTKEGMIGMVFRKPTNIELAPDIEYLKEPNGLSSVFTIV